MAGCTVVDRIGLPAHICFPGIAAAFTATACFFFTAKSTTDLCADVPILTLAIPQSLPAWERNCSASRIFSVMIEEDKSLRHLVLNGNGFFDGFIFQQIEYGGKCFMLHDIE